MRSSIRASAFALAVSVGTSAFGVQLIQNFDTNPADWLVDNTVTPQGGTVPDPPAAGNDLGFSNTNKAGGTAGEAGGRFTRLRNDLDTTDANATLRGARYDTAVGSLDPKTQSLTMSGLLNYPGSETNELIGWYDPATIFPFRPDDFIGFRSDSRTLRVNAYAGGTQIFDAPVGGNYPESFTFVFTPTVDGATIEGTITDLVANVAADTVQTGVTPFSMTMTAAQRDAFVTAFTRFGLFTLDNNQTNNGFAYYDNLSYTSAIPEPATLSLLGLGGLLALRRRGR
jgi:hypothetical protein